MDIDWAVSLDIGGVGWCIGREFRTGVAAVCVPLVACRRNWYDGRIRATPDIAGAAIQMAIRISDGQLFKVILLRRTRT